MQVTRLVRTGACAALMAGCLMLAAGPQPYETLDETGFEEFVFEEVDETDAVEPSGVETDLGTLDAAHAAYVRRGDLQLERPERLPEEVKSAAPPPDWLAALADFLEALRPLFQLIFYAAIALVIGGVLYFIFGEAVRARFGLRRKIDTRREDDVIADYRPEERAARSLLEEADALARQGRFGEAVHLLLFRSIDELHGRIRGGIPDALTAREIARLAALPERPRAALAPIIRIVEQSFFGGRDVDVNGWKTARASYEAFAFGEGWT